MIPLTMRVGFRGRAAAFEFCASGHLVVNENHRFAVPKTLLRWRFGRPCLVGKCLARLDDPNLMIGKSQVPVRQFHFRHVATHAI